MNRLFSHLLILIILLSIQQSHAKTYPVYTISNFLGGGVTVGDGGLAINAQIDSPSGIAINSKGEVLVVQNMNARIRKVDSNGLVSTIAGTGISSESSGNGGLATDAVLGYPVGIALNENDEIYLVEYGNHLVRKILTNGTILPFAGKLHSAGYGGDGGPATNTSLFFPYGIAYNPFTGDVLISDGFNHRIRKVNTKGIISTVAGNGNTGYDNDNVLATETNIENPSFLTVNSQGDILAAISGASRICKVSNSTGIISTIAGNGTYSFSGDGNLAIYSVLKFAKGVALGRNGEIFIADTSNYVIRRISPEGIITTIAGSPGTFGYGGDNGLATNALLNNPTGMAIDSNGTIYFSDSFNNRVRKLVPYCVEGMLVNGSCLFPCFGVSNIGANVCDGHGQCVATNSCLCDSGWTGKECSIISCDGFMNNCSGHGLCVSNNTCQCHEGWKGNSQCSQTSCEGVDNCDGRGTCTGPNTCTCSSGFFGNKCQYRSCFENVNNQLPNYGNRPNSISEKLCIKINKQLI